MIITFGLPTEARLRSEEEPLSSLLGRFFVMHPIGEVRVVDGSATAIFMGCIRRGLSIVMESIYIRSGRHSRAQLTSTEVLVSAVSRAMGSAAETMRTPSVNERRENQNDNTYPP